jgi:hypothetical protein
MWISPQIHALVFQDIGPFAEDTSVYLHPNFFSGE